MVLLDLRVEGPQAELDAFVQGVKGLFHLAAGLRWDRSDRRLLDRRHGPNFRRSRGVGLRQLEGDNLVDERGRSRDDPAMERIHDRPCVLLKDARQFRTINLGMENICSLLSSGALIYRGII